MLDCHSHASSLREAIASLPCEVDLPESWRGFFDQAGALPTVPDDRRRFPRFCLRTAAAMRFRENMSTLNRSDQWHKVFAKDVSRAGFSFLHSEQLFPRERLELVVDESHRYVGEVRRCRRVGPRCYVVGAQFCDDAAPDISFCSGSEIE